MKTFRDELKAYLAWKQLRPYQLAGKAGVPWSCVYQYLRGKATLRLTTVEKLKQAMDD